MNKIFRVIWSHAQQAWVVVSELVKSHTKTSTYTDKRAQVCISDYFLDKQQDKFKLSLLSLVLLSIFFSPVAVGVERHKGSPYLQDGAGKSDLGTDDGTIGIGKESKAGYGAIAIGQKSKAEARHNIAIGYDSNAGTGANSITIGYNTKVTGEEGIAIGKQSKAGGRSVVLGGQAKGTSTQTVAIGNLATHGIAIGYQTNAGTHVNSVAVGNDIQVRGEEAVAIGSSSKAGKGSTDSIAIGNSAKTTGADSVVVGANINVTGEKLVAIGRQANSGSHSTALGDMASASGMHSVAVGENAMINDGAARATALGNNTVVTVGGGVALGYGSKADTAGGVAIGARSSSTAEYGIAVGGGATAGKNAVAVDRDSKGTGTNSIAIGNSAKTTGADSVVEGANMELTGAKLIEIDGDSKTDTPKVGLWGNAKALVDTSGEIKTTASGDTITLKLDETLNNKINKIDSGVALVNVSKGAGEGNPPNAEQTHSVTTEASTDKNGFKSTGSVDNNSIPIGAVTVGNDKMKRQIVNVAAGTHDTGEVNVAQLK
ncbi:hep_Hag family protein [Glaesserella parasuis MN-H]|nr:hep_Hag family protein [Glaesserella parasuis MN-H]